MGAERISGLMDQCDSFIDTSCKYLTYFCSKLYSPVERSRRRETD